MIRCADLHAVIARCLTCVLAFGELAHLRVCWKYGKTMGKEEKGGNQVGTSREQERNKRVTREEQREKQGGKGWTKEKERANEEKTTETRDETHGKQREEGKQREGRKKGKTKRGPSPSIERRTTRPPQEPQPTQSTDATLRPSRRSVNLRPEEPPSRSKVCDEPRAHAEGAGTLASRRSLEMLTTRTHAPGGTFDEIVPIWALYFRRDLTQLEVLRVTHAADQLLRLFAKLTEFLSRVQILHQRVTVRVCIKLVDHFLDHFSAIIVFFLDC